MCLIKQSVYGKALTDNLVYICGALRLFKGCHLLVYLQQEKVFSLNEIVEIQKDCETKSLIDRLYEKPAKDFEKFLTGLEVDSQHVAEKLTEYLKELENSHPCEPEVSKESSPANDTFDISNHENFQRCMNISLHLNASTDSLSPNEKIKSKPKSKSESDIQLQRGGYKEDNNGTSYQSRYHEKGDYAIGPNFQKARSVSTNEMGYLVRDNTSLNSLGSYTLSVGSEDQVFYFEGTPEWHADRKVKQHGPLKQDGTCNYDDVTKQKPCDSPLYLETGFKRLQRPGPLCLTDKEWEIIDGTPNQGNQLLNTSLSSSGEYCSNYPRSPSTLYEANQGSEDLLDGFHRGDSYSYNLNSSPTTDVGDFSNTISTGASYVCENRSIQKKEPIYETLIAPQSSSNTFDKTSRNDEQTFCPRSLEILHGETQRCDYDLQIPICGESGVGKTFLLQTFCKLNYKSNHGMQQTCVNYRSRTGEILKVSYIDLPGDELTRDTLKLHIKLYDAVLLVYDTSDTASPKTLKKWLHIISSIKDNSFPVLVVGNTKRKYGAKVENVDLMKTFAKFEDKLTVFPVKIKPSSGDEIGSAFERLISMAQTYQKKHLAPQDKGRSKQKWMSWKSLF